VHDWYGDQGFSGVVGIVEYVVELMMGTV